jgi:hypothetical protein
MNEENFSAAEIEAAAWFHARECYAVEKVIEIARLQYDCHNIATDYQNDSQN